MQLTELVCMLIITMDSEIPGVSSEQGTRLQYLKKTKLFFKTCQFRPQMWLTAKWKNALEPGSGLYPSLLFLSLL